MEYTNNNNLLRDIDPVYFSTRGWLLFLQGLFSTRTSGNLRWSPNIEETEVIIADQEFNVGGQGNNRPRIITQRSPATILNLGRDQVLYRSFSGENKTFGLVLSCSMTFNCIAREGIEAQNIGYHIIRSIHLFRPSIQRLGRIHQIANEISLLPETRIGEIFPGSSDPEWKVVRVVVPFTVQDQFTYEEDYYSTLRAVDLHMETGLGVTTTSIEYGDSN